MTTPLDDGDIGSMIQDAVEQAIGQALPNLLDAMSDRLSALGGSGSGRGRVDPAQIQRAVYDAISAWQRNNPTAPTETSGEAQQTELINAVANAVSQQIGEQSKRIGGRIRNLENALNQRLEALQANPPGGGDWQETVSQESRDRRLEQMSRERQERTRTPRLERNAEIRNEANERNFDISMRALDIEEQRVQQGTQQADETHQILREILTVLQSGGAVVGGDTDEAGQVKPEEAYRVVQESSAMGRQPRYSENLISELDKEGMDDPTKRLSRRESVKAVDESTRFSSSRYSDASRSSQTYANMRDRYMFGDNSGIASPDTNANIVVDQALTPPPIEKEPDPRAANREQAYLASRWTNIAGSQAYGVGAYAAELGIPGLPRFAGQEASMIRAAGSLATGLTMLGVKASAVVPPLMAATLVIGTMSVAAISMYKETEAARRQANLIGADMSGLFGAYGNVAGTNLKMSDTGVSPFSTQYAYTQWEAMGEDDRMKFATENLGAVTKMGDMGVWQQYNPNIENIDQAMMVWHAIQSAKGTDAAGSAFAAEQQIAQIAAGPHAAVAGQLMGQFASRAPSADLISTLGQYNIDPQGTLASQFGGGFGTKDMVSYMQRLGLDSEKNVWMDSVALQKALEEEGAVPGGGGGFTNRLQLQGLDAWRTFSAPWNPNPNRPFFAQQGTDAEFKQMVSDIRQLVRNTTPERPPR